MKKHCILLFFYCLNLLMNTAGAYNLKQVADKEYMSNSSITSLCQDDKGLMWIGTCDGLNIYDGQEIEEFKTRDKEDYLSGNQIDNIIYTGNDTYWFQTYYSLIRLDRKTNSITRFNEFQKLFLMNKDNHGTLFIIKDTNCIYYFHKKEGIFKKINVTGIPISDVITFFFDKNNRMWVMMKGYNRCYDLQQDPLTENITLVSQKSGLDHHTPLICSFYDDAAVYYVDKEYNLYAFHIESKKNEFIANLGANIQAHDKISSIVKYHDSFFVGLMMDGVLVLERQKDSGEYQIQSLPINSGTFSLIKDRFQDVVWIGTDGQGVYLYSNPLYSIKSVVLNNYTEKIERPVRALLLDKERTFWIGTKGNGILKIFDYEVQKNISDCRSEILTTSNSGLGSNAVYCIRESNHNLLWIGDEEGLNFYSYRERRIKKLPLWIDNEEFKYIHDIYETEDSELWLASVGMGVVRARIGGTPDHPVLENVQRYVVNGGEFGSNYFFTICKGDSLNLLFGNMGYGVYRFNKTINGLEPLTTHKYENMNLNKVVPIIKDDADNYLIGTTYGVIKYASENSYQLFNAKDGFLNSTIHAILRHSSDNFWLSTNQGLINFDTKRNVFRSYGFGDGLKVVEFSDGASYRDPQTGILFFGGINGFVAIQADGRPEQLYMPPIYFDKLSIFGEQYNLGEFITRKKENEVLNLKYDQNFFAVSFTSVDYLNGNNCTYSYKLKGLSDQWINNGKESSVSFTNMAPGEYTLLVKYYNSVFDKESEVYSLLIRIGDPWYASWWAYLIYSLCLLMIAAMLVRSFILRTKRKKQELLNEIEKRHQKNVFESKLRFFTNIAHEFCTPLTLIYGPCGRILSSKGLSKFVVDYVQMIQTNAERLNNLIHELIEFRRIETGNREVRIEALNVSSLMKNTAKTFVDMAKSRNITFLSKIPEQVSWNSDKGFLNTIIINLISNAFKYTPDGKSIKIEVDTNDENLLVLRVANEGSTIKEEDFQYVFNRYAILDSFENQDEKNFSRNGLGLAISYNMAKLLNGMLKVENTPDGWVLFTLSLPPLEVTTGVSSSKRITSEYIPKIESQLVLKLPHYEFDKMRPTLLVIDDELEMLWFIGEIFSNDFNVVTLQEPERVEQVLNEVYPNVIICDIMMPGIGGIELTKRIKSVKETSHIPIIMVSGRHEMEQQMAALSAGAEMYITKPFNAEYLRISVCQMLERKEVLKDYFSSAISSFEKTDGKLTHKESKKFQQSVLKIINDHIQEKELTPRFIADHLAISVRSLYRKMEEMGEESPTIMIKECRLYVAKDLLLKTKKTIDEIVFEAGFSNKVTFFKVFREKYGCTPKEFRTKHLEEVQ